MEDALIGRFGSLARLAKPLTLRSDNGLVFTSKRFTVTVQRYGLQQEFIQPHTPQQNIFKRSKEMSNVSQNMPTNSITKLQP